MNNDEYNVFTKDENGVNLSINNLEVGCITNQNNKFSIDTEGNITANSIQVANNTNPNISYEEIFDKIYPIGSIYISLNSTNPNTFFGGTWERFAIGQTLIGVDSAQVGFNTASKTGGTQTHTHVIPSHNHKEASHTHSLNDAGFACFSMGNAQLNQREISTPAWNQNYKKEISSTANNFSYSRTYGTALGGTTADKTNTTYTGYTNEQNTTSSSNLPPYITCYIWKRTN